MSKAVMISIRPEWVSMIINGYKTVEVRKTRPKLDAPFKCYIYCTRKEKDGIKDIIINPDRDRAYRGMGKVVAEFTCDEIFDLWPGYTGKKGDDMLTFDEREAYLGERGHGYGWHISDVKIFDYPMYIKEFLQTGCDFAATCGCCRHGVFENADCFDCEYSLKRAPQSWCYVEETI